MDIYDRLKVPKVINAYDTMTYLGGSIMDPEIVQAMAEASRHFVDIQVLHQRVGEELAQLTKNEAALVCGGAAAGLALATAACIAGVDLGAKERLPDTVGLKNEVIIHRSQRNAYDQAIRQAGARLIEIGYFDGTSRAQLEAAITPQTAAISYFVGTTFEKTALPFKEVIEVAKAHKIPVIVDAAAQLPPVENLWKYTQIGADLVLFSGGKGLGGPQGSGLIVGSREYIEKCALHSCPNDGLGRSMKTSKEDVVGLLTAVKRFVNLDHEGELRKREEMVRTVLAEVSGIPGVRGWRAFPARLGQTYPRAMVTLEENFPVNRAQILHALQRGEPRIELGSYELDENTLYVNPLSLTFEEAQLVAERLRACLIQFSQGV